MKHTICLLFAVLLLSSQALCADIVVDNDDGAPGYGETGAWNTSGSTGYQGSTYRYCFGTGGAPTSSATWTPTIPSRNTYEVYAAYLQSPNRSETTHVTITHSDGTTELELNQNGAHALVEKLLGKFTFDAGTSGSVRIDNRGSSTQAAVIADAMIWRILVNPPPEISDIAHTPEIPGATDSVRVTATITDDEQVASASLRYSVMSSAISESVPAIRESGDVFSATIPAQPEGSIIEYAFTAEDNFGQATTSRAYYYASGPLPLFLPDVVVDNDDGAPAYVETGTWILSSSTGYDGGTYRYATKTSGDPTSTATWTPAVPRTGIYRVYAAFAAGGNRTPDAPIVIGHAGGETRVHLDQTGNGMVESFLGQFPFEQGAPAFARMENNGAAGAYIADAMIWRMPTDPLPVISRVSRSPIIPDAGEPLQVTCRITDNMSVATASIVYTVDGAQHTVTMQSDGGDMFSGTIAPLPDGATIRYHISATDNLGQSAESTPQSFIVGQEARNVYIVLGSDTSVWGVTGGYYGTAPWDVFESRTGVLAKLYDPVFRESHVDSLGRPFKLTWFMHGGAWFTTAVNSTPISATYHIRKNWGADIEKWDDPIEYHFHHYAWNGGWEMAPTFAETIWEYEAVMSQMMIDEKVFITSFRSGWNYMDNPYQQYLERWVPFRMEGVRSGYVPYHPSVDNYREPGTMKGWEVRHLYTKSVSESIATQILRAASLGEDQVVCIWSHQNEADFPEQIHNVDRNFHAAQANYPGVQFHYLGADEAMRAWLDVTTTTPPPLKLTPSIMGDRVDVVIETADGIYQEQPWVAARPYEGYYVRLDTTKTAPGVWQFSYSKQEYDRVAVGVSDIYGNDVLAEVDDGSRRWTFQSEFASGIVRDLDVDTTPTLALLAMQEGVYVPSGSLTLEHQKSSSGPWQSIAIESDIPAGTTIRSRYTTAGTEELLASATWSDWTDARVITLPPATTAPWLRVEVVLEGTADATPALDAVEVKYSVSSAADQWVLY